MINGAIWGVKFYRIAQLDRKDLLDNDLWPAAAVTVARLHQRPHKPEAQAKEFATPPSLARQACILAKSSVGRALTGKIGTIIEVPTVFVRIISS
jgi:hypothetical protein